MSNLRKVWYDPDTGKVFEDVPKSGKAERGSLVTSAGNGQKTKSKSRRPPAPPPPSAEAKPREKKTVRYIDESVTDSDASDYSSEESQRPPPKSKSKAAQPGRGGSPWITHCREWAKTQGISYASAVSDPNCRNAYHSGK